MIRLVLIRLAIVVALTAALLAVRLHDDPEHARPPHAERPTAGVNTEPALPALSGADPEGSGQLVLVAAYLEGLERERIAEEERLAREAAEAEAARLEAARQVARTTPPRNGTSSQPTSCDGHIIPGYILQRESGCNYGAVNPTGCGGASCVGLYQFDLRHFTSGACAGLDWHNPADQDECARRISNNGTNLRPWGG